MSSTTSWNISHALIYAPQQFPPCLFVQFPCSKKRPNKIKTRQKTQRKMLILWRENDLKHVMLQAKTQNHWPLFILAMYGTANEYRWFITICSVPQVNFCLKKSFILSQLKRDGWEVYLKLKEMKQNEHRLNQLKLKALAINPKSFIFKDNKIWTASQWPYQMPYTISTHTYTNSDYLFFSPHKSTTKTRRGGKKPK